jgi:hypothetical protein
VNIYFDVSFEHQDFKLIVDDLGQGSVRLSVAAVNNTLGFDKVRFDRFVQIPSVDGSIPLFVTSFFYREESASGSIVVTEQEPGIYFYGATPSYHGRPGQCTAGGEHDGKPSEHPTALILAGPDGSLNNQSLPPGFAGWVTLDTHLHYTHLFEFESAVALFDRAPPAPPP